MDLADGCGKTALHHASEKGNLDAARMCLERGAEVDRVDMLRRTPLYLACARGHVDVATLLIDRGADIELTEQESWTPLYVACRNGELGVIALLLHRGAKTVWSDPDRHGDTPLHAAFTFRQVDAARLLLEAGADCEQANSWGWSPLHIACRDGRIKSARLLIKHGARIDRVCRTVSPLQLACKNAKVTTARLLLECGANINRLHPDLVRAVGHGSGRDAAVAWLARVRAAGWTRYLSEPRYKLVVLRDLAGRGRAQRVHTFHGNELALDFLFPGQPSSQAKRVAHLPDDIFAIITRYYWCGEP
mmetsp:Transcript_5427/g.16096  ORF Transcript_5427/g.16096 Transcript_5427/m.16096 type:complete len:304 (-) Transcript_5427:62-973(-)